MRPAVGLEGGEDLQKKRLVVFNGEIISASPSNRAVRTKTISMISNKSAMNINTSNQHPMLPFQAHPYTGSSSIRQDKEHGISKLSIHCLCRRSLPWSWPTGTEYNSHYTF
jgi:hypothetical protein